MEAGGRPEGARGEPGAAGRREEKGGPRQARPARGGGPQGLRGDQEGSEASKGVGIWRSL